jgi:hypothetical protein
MESKSKSETAQANANPDSQQPKLDIMQRVKILAACILIERYWLGRELMMYRLLKEVYGEPGDEDDPEEGEEDDEDVDDDIPDLEITDDDGWDEDFDENGLRYWVPDEIWIPVDELDAEEETEPVDSKIVPIGWKADYDYNNDSD